MRYNILSALFHNHYSNHNNIWEKNISTIRCIKLHFIWTISRRSFVIVRGDHVIKQESYELIDIFPNNQTVAPVRFASHHYQCYHDIVHSLIASHKHTYTHTIHLICSMWWIKTLYANVINLQTVDWITSSSYWMYIVNIYLQTSICWRAFATLAIVIAAIFQYGDDSIFCSMFFVSARTCWSSILNVTSFFLLRSPVSRSPSLLLPSKTYLGRCANPFALISRNESQAYR